jgi:hypothetical protein
VTTDLRRAARVLALATIALVFVAGLVPGRLELAARIYALVLAATVLGIMLAALRRAYPPATPPRQASRGGSGDRQIHPPTLVRLERACMLGIARSFDLHHRVRPLLREIAVPLLSVRRGISLDDSPHAAQRALGEKTWELVRPDRPPPRDRHASGISGTSLRSVVESLERL